MTTLVFLLLSFLSAGLAFALVREHRTRKTLQRLLHRVIDSQHKQESNETTATAVPAGPGRRDCDQRV